MANPLYNGLSDDFDRHDGSLSPYVNNTLITLPYEKHYDLRAFHTTNMTVPWTANDNSWWNGFRYTDFGTPQIGNQRTIVNVVLRDRTQTEMDVLTQTVLDGLVQSAIDKVNANNGNEDWPASDVNVTVGKDSAFRYSNSIRIALSSGVQKIVESRFTDDIQTDFNDGGTYFLSLVLRSFPSQADAAHLNLSNSSVEVSSDINFDATKTDTLSFSNSIINLTGTTGSFDTAAKWPITSLVKADKSNIKAIRFNLTSVGAMTFIAQSLRVVPNGLLDRVISLDTKRQTLRRWIPQLGGSETASTFGDMYFSQTRPKRLTTYILFNSGHLPATGSDDNIIRHYYRYNPTTGDRIEVRVATRSTQTRLFIDQRIAGVTTNLASTPINTNIMTPELDYYLVVNLADDTNISATIYLANGQLLSTTLVTTSGVTTLAARGYVGMSFEPYYYDFVMRYFGTSMAEFGRFRATPFASLTPVVGATLYPRASGVLNMLNGGTIEAFGDATVTTTDNNTFTATRTGISTQGGIRYSKAVYIGESGQVAVTGKIFPVTQIRGTYRLGLIDENDSVHWIYNFPSLLSNQWNDFSVFLPTNLNPVEYYLHVQQNGSYADTFYVRNLALAHNTLLWEANSDGTNYQPFLNALNDRWSAVKFGTAGKTLTLRATAKSDKAFISGYNLVPRYLP